MARSFDGSGDLSAIFTLTVSNPCAFGCWIRTDDETASNRSAFAIGHSFASNRMRGLRLNSAHQAEYYFTGFTSAFASSSATLTGTSQLNDGNWHHIFGISLSGTSHALYVDGELEASSSTDVSFWNSPDRISVGSIILTGSPQEHFIGQIAECCIWGTLAAQALANLSALARGLSPLAFPRAVDVYYKITGRLSPETPSRLGDALTVTGTSAADHPPIIYPTIPRRRRALSSDPSPKTRRGHAVTIDTSIGEMGSIFAERNVLHADESSAGVSIFPDISGQSSHWLCVLMYSRLPPDATPVGMQVTVKHRYVDSPDNMVSMSSVKAMAIKGGSLVGDELTLDGVPSLADDWAESSAGGATELWGTTWEADDWNAIDSDGKPTSGVALRWISNNSSPDQYGAIDVEHVRITRWYSQGGTVYEDVAVGGITFGGSASIGAAMTFEGAGGAIVGGAATTQSALAAAGSGGVSLAGAAEIAASLAESAAGGVAIGGAATDQQTASLLAAGGVAIDGAASAAQTHVDVGSGGVEISGSISTGNVSSEAGNGGTTLGGAALEQLVASVLASGGATIGGSATETLDANVSASGGVALSGQAIVAGVYGMSASGGVVLGGSAGVAATYAQAGSGGVTVAGQADVAMVISVAGSGGVTLGGAAIVATGGDHLVIRWTREAITHPGLASQSVMTSVLISESITVSAFFEEDLL